MNSTAPCSAPSCDFAIPRETCTGTGYTKEEFSEESFAQIVRREPVRPIGIRAS
jgi:hypothetical protein